MNIMRLIKEILKEKGRIFEKNACQQVAAIVARGYCQSSELVNGWNA